MKNCVIYTRVSTSMQAEKDYNSCEAQRDKILSYVKSQEDLEVYKEYSDPGFSGGSLERPGLNQLLRDIATGAIQAVLTYKIDRLTRSSKDFYSLIEYFEKHGVTFVSVTEHFDTSSPSGRLLRNIMLTFAQFEREMIVERTKDKMLQRAEKGLWNILRNVRYIGYMIYAGKTYKAENEAIISKELFEEAKSLRNKKIIKQQLYKEYPLAKLISCTECGSQMTPSFANKPTRRYYYYKCYKVVRDSKACGLKEVNAEKLEAFLIENLSRLSGDKQYIENLAFKIAHETGGRYGFEPRTIWSSSFSTRISQVLMDFKNTVQKANQVEKCLIFQKTIRGIKFSRHSLEVSIFIKDTNESEVDDFFNGQSGKMAAGIRVGAAILTAPAQTPSSKLKLG